MERERKKHKKCNLVLGTIIGILLILLAVCAVYVMDYYHAEDTVWEALQSDSSVTVSQIHRDTVVFLPENPKVGFIFYPGGKVEYTAYAPLLHRLADHGLLCILIKMPCNLAVLDSNAANGIQEEFPDIDRWYIGGHSLGGSMAAAYVGKHVDEYEGLILFAAYSTEDLRQSGLNVISLYGSYDGVLNMEKYEKNLANLPVGRKEYVIEGGCHAQFGNYGRQSGDGVAVISGEGQQKIAVQYIIEEIEDAIE